MIMTRKGKVFITVEEIVNYLTGLKHDLENQFEWNKNQAEKRVPNPELRKIINKIDEDNFVFLIGKIDKVVEDLNKHLTFSLVNATKESEKRKVRNKCECSACKKQYKSKTSLIDVAGIDGLYKRYCDDCFKVKFKEYEKLGIISLKKGVELDKLTHKDLTELNRVLDVCVPNYIFSHPDLVKKIMESEPFKKMEEEFGLNKGQIIGKGE